MKCLPMPIKRVASRLLDLGRLTWDDLLEVQPACASGVPYTLCSLGTLCTLCTLCTSTSRPCASAPLHHRVSAP